MKKIARLSLFLAPLALLGCVKGGETSFEMAQGQNWVLSSIDGHAFERKGDILPRFSIDEAFNVNGYTGCNNFTGQAELKNEQLRVKQIVSTKKMCIGEAMKAEDTMLTALSTWSNLSITRDKMTLENEKHHLKFSSVTE